MLMAGQRQHEFRQHDAADAAHAAHAAYAAYAAYAVANGPNVHAYGNFPA